MSAGTGPGRGAFRAGTGSSQHVIEAYQLGVRAGRKQVGHEAGVSAAEYYEIYKAVLDDLSGIGDEPSTGWIPDLGDDDE